MLAGVQDDPHYRELGGRQVVLAVLVAVDIHTAIWREACQQLHQFIDGHGPLSPLQLSPDGYTAALTPPASNCLLTFPLPTSCDSSR